MNDPTIAEYDSGHRTRLSTVVATMNALAGAGPDGMTSREVGAALWPGDNSGVARACSPLNRLHRDGRIVGLAEKRDGHHVYVIPELVEDREVWTGYRHRGHCASCTCGADS